MLKYSLDNCNGKDIVIKGNPQYTKERDFALHYVNKLTTKPNGFAPININEFATYDLSNLDIYSIQNKCGADMEIVYVAEHIQTESLENLINKVYYNKCIGQFENTFYPKHSIRKDLQLKYNEDYENGYTELISINGLSIEANPGTLLYVKD